VSKFKVEFNLDLTQIAPEAVEETGEISLAAVSQTVSKMLLQQARKAAKDRMHQIRRDPNLDADVKVIQMSEQVRNMMLTLMAEANLKVERLCDEVEILTELPFEQNYKDDIQQAA
jgi:hypothetical protein